MPTPLTLARERVRELRAGKANAQAAVKEAEVARAPFAKRLATFLARAHKQQVIAHVAGRYQLMTLQSLAVESYNLVSTFEGKKKADIYDAIDNGGVALSVTGGGYGVSYKAKGLTPRLRTPDPVAVKAWEKAVKASKRADERAEAAQRAEDFALEAVFQTGTPIERTALVEHLAQRVVLQVALDKHRPDYEAERRLKHGEYSDDEWSALTRAERHLAHLTQKVEDAECNVCHTEAVQAERDAAQAAADKAKREALLAHIDGLTEARLLECPTHGRKRMKFERRKVHLTEADGREHDVEDAPVGFCMADRKAGPHLVLDKKQREKDLAKAAKTDARAQAAARVAIKRAARRAEAAPPDVPIPAGAWVEFTCPNCEWVSQDEAVDDPESGLNTVSCPNCGTDWNVDAVKTRLVERQAA